MTLKRDDKTLVDGEGKKVDLSSNASEFGEQTKDIFAISVENSLILNQGTGVTISNTGVGFNGSTALSQNIAIGQAVETTSNVTFNQITGTSLVFGNPTVYSYTGISGSLAITGSLTAGSNFTVNGNASVNGTLIAKEFKTTYVSSSIVFQSGSTRFGDTIDDSHHFTGSLSTTGSFSLNGYQVTEISNDATLGDASSGSLVTEYALQQYAGVSVAADQAYLRKSFFKSSNQILNNSTASFTAVTASAPATLTSTNENDFVFFINGQYMEHDAHTIEQSGSSFLLQVDTSGIGYSLESDDEIIAIGKFNA